MLGLTLAVLLVGIQQYAWDELSGGRLPYLPDSWYSEYREVYERAGLPLGLTPYYFWGASRSSSTEPHSWEHGRCPMAVLASREWVDDSCSSPWRSAWWGTWRIGEAPTRRTSPL